MKIEVTPVLRGCVYEPAIKSVSAGVEVEFGFAEMLVVSFADLYAGKIVAALDRQHPRDLFDVRDLLAHEGVDDSLRKARPWRSSTAWIVLLAGIGIPENLRSKRSRIFRAPQLACSRFTFTIKFST